MTTTAPTPRTSPAPPDAGIASRVALVAMVTWLAISAVRATGPVLDQAFTIGVLQVAGAALGTYLVLPGLVAWALLAGTGRRDGTAGTRTLLWAVAATGALRIGAQLFEGPRFWLGLASAATAVTALVLTAGSVAGRPAGGRQTTIGLLLGSGLSVAGQLVLGTWDALWRGTAGTVLAVALVVVAVVLALVVARSGADAEPTGRPRRTWAMGPALALLVMVLANPAFVAAQAGVRVATAAGTLVLACAAGVWLLLVPHVLTPAVRIVATVLLPVATAGAFWLTDAVALAAVAVAVLALAVVLGSALTTRRPARPGLGGAALAVSGVGGSLVTVLLVYLLDYDVPLPVDNAWVVVLAALLLALSGLRRTTPPVPGTDPEPASPAAVAPPLRANALRMLVLPSMLVALLGWWHPWPWGTTVTSTDRAAGTLTVLDWNLHYGVSSHTTVDLEQIARTIDEAQPDVVTLQELSRGWVLGGGADMAQWLADRLGMHLTYAPAADQQFGNVLLSRTELTDVQVIDLPYGEGPQQRSALTARVRAEDGTWYRVTTVHLQHRDENTATRLDQLDTLLAALPNDGPSILAGDLNAEPGWPEIDLITADGWTSALDAVDDADALTYPSDDPEIRIDWAFTRQATVTDAHVGTDTSSDHLPLTLTITTP